MKRHILMTLWVVILILSFFFWIYGIGSRLYLTAMAPDPVQALFHLDSSIRISALQQGYGDYAFWRTVSSLFDSRFVMTAVILLTGLLSAAVSCRQQYKKKMDWYHDYAALQKRVTKLEGLLRAQDRDMKVRREEQENFAHQLKSSLNSLSLRLELEGLYEPAEESFALMDSQLDKFT